MTDRVLAAASPEFSHQAEVHELRPLLLDDAALVRAVASGRQRNATLQFRRVDLRYVDLRAGRRLQITSYDQTQASSRNVDLGPAAERAIDDLLALPFSNWRVETASETVQLRVTKRGRALVHRSVADVAPALDRTHDRRKSRWLAEDDELFRVLGLATVDGRIKPSRRAKFRQVQDFIAALEPTLADLEGAVDGVEQKLTADSPLRLVDLGCGNAYLTFAAFHYLSSVKQLPVRAVGVDQRPSARAHNQEVAERLGIAESFEFIDSPIDAAELANSPDIVIALHACDTATDDALARAVTWQAPVVLAAPCCHHDVQRQLSGQSPPPPYELLTRYGILRERFGDVLTDALRAAVLRMVGYRVDVVEFVDAEHTPRNILIRAVRTGAAPEPAAVAAYLQIVRDWHVTPALADRLAGAHTAFRRPAAR